MQKDFHHAVTYVCARLAGFAAEDASIIAYAAQYVDNATHDEAITFTNQAVYMQEVSAHEMLDFNNMDDAKNCKVWLPFHFLPGNQGLKAGDAQEMSFLQKIVCRPNSYIAQDMVDNLIKQQGDLSYRLHWLGITMHVYADTWAHQGFAGILDDINDVKDLDEFETDVFSGPIKELKEKVILSAVPTLGHGQAGFYPDMPFLKWRYINGRDEVIDRDNTQDFCEAADHMCKAMQRFRGLPEAQINGIADSILANMRHNFKSFQDIDGDVRHEKWLESIEAGEVSGEMKGERPVYVIGENPGGWKYDILGVGGDTTKPSYDYPDGFLTSNWKLFHDAMKAHRFHLLQNILPNYGICGA
ncbi:DUF6765 family protein [Magnetococcus sp. PR-3]|uniref:DUF6765 family protein n=1 Tax=Magnetococcus sp. PR-3 TaxID=3120355 RepID=UPI002FCE6582